MPKMAKQMCKNGQNGNFLYSNGQNIPGIPTANKLTKKGQTWPKMAKKYQEMAKYGNLWVPKWSKLSEKITLPVSGILSNFYFMTQVIIATQSALNRYPDPIKKICFCQLSNFC